MPPVRPEMDQNPLEQAGLLDPKRNDITGSIDPPRSLPLTDRRLSLSGGPCIGDCIEQHAWQGSSDQLTIR